MSGRRGVTVKDVAPADFIAAYAAHLKKTGKVEVPKWADIAKTSVQRELGPLDGDWFYIRAASLARKLYLRQGTGVGAFRKVYGASKNNGTKKSHFAKASSHVIRLALQQLEKIGNVEKLSTGGRKITRSGQRDLDSIATQIINSKA